VTSRSAVGCLRRPCRRSSFVPHGRRRTLRLGTEWTLAPGRPSSSGRRWVRRRGRRPDSPLRRGAARATTSRSALGRPAAAVTASGAPRGNQGAPSHPFLRFFSLSLLYATAANWIYPFLQTATSFCVLNGSRILKASSSFCASTVRFFSVWDALFYLVCIFYYFLRLF